MLWGSWKCPGIFCNQETGNHGLELRHLQLADNHTMEDVHRVSEKKLDPLIFHHIFALTAMNCMKISSSIQEALLVVNME